MSTLSIKLDPELEQALLQASEHENLSKSELVRRALTSYLHRHATASPSALEKVDDLVGCFSGGPTDLSTNPRHLDGFGQT